MPLREQIELFQLNKFVNFLELLLIMIA